MKKITLSEWEQAEREYAVRFDTPIPKGWISAREYAEKSNMTTSSASTKLKNMWIKGFVERREWKLDGVNSISYIYRPKSK